MSDESQETAVGIDLGTTCSVVARLEAEGRPATVPNAEGNYSTPSAVLLDAAGAIVGQEALKALEFCPDRVAQSPKRDLGRSAFRDPVRGEFLPPEVLQALILRKLKQDAELTCGPLKKAVITVPAYFSEACRKAAQDAGRMAGWDVLDILNEPLAAALAYGLRRGFLSPQSGSHQTEKILVFDLGGGALDITLLRIEGQQFTALATAGDVTLGGSDWDLRIVDFLATKYQEQFGVDPRETRTDAKRLQFVAEEAKRTLTVRSEATLQFHTEQQRLRTMLTRAQFEGLTADLVERALLLLRTLMFDALLAYKDLTRVLVVGGATRMPMIAAALAKEIGLPIDRHALPNEAVAHGAALYAGLLLQPEARERRWQITNVNPHDLGVLGVEPGTGLKRRKLMIPRNSPLPAKKVCRFATQRPNQTSLPVYVVEGGDAAGLGATSIGRCVVSGFPPDLPANTPIDVRFKYAENGRFSVRAVLPTINKEAQVTLERASGMSRDLAEAWAQCVAEGLPDGYQRPDLPQSPLPARPAPVERTAESPEAPQEECGLDFTGAMTIQVDSPAEDTSTRLEGGVLDFLNDIDLPATSPKKKPRR